MFYLYIHESVCDVLSGVKNYFLGVISYNGSVKFYVVGQQMQRLLSLFCKRRLSHKGVNGFKNYMFITVYFNHKPTKHRS